MWKMGGNEGKEDRSRSSSICLPLPSGFLSVLVVNDAFKGRVWLRDQGRMKEGRVREGREEERKKSRDRNVQGLATRSRGNK